MISFDSPTGKLLRLGASLGRDARFQARARELAAEVVWEDFAKLAIEHRIAPLVLRNVSEMLPADTRARLQTASLRSAQVNLRLSAELMRVFDTLGAAGVRAIPFKGPITAQLYGDLSLRPFGDLDLFVFEEDVWKACDALVAAGFAPETDVPKHMEADVLRWGCEYNLISPDRTFVVELHWRVAPHAYAMDWAFTRQTETKAADLNGQKLTTLSNELHLLVLCLHAAKHVWNTLLWLNDIGLAMRQPIDWKRLGNAARGAGALRICATSFSLAERLLDHEIPSEAHEQFGNDRQSSLLVDELCRRMFALRSEVLSCRDHKLLLRSRERMRDRAAYLWRLSTGPDLYAMKAGLEGRLARARKVVSGSTAGTRG